MAFDPREMLVETFVKQMEKGVAPWVMPWAKIKLVRPWNVVANKPYSGINVLFLMAAQIDRGFTSGRWLTSKQGTSLGGKLLKEEIGRSTPVAFYKPIPKTDQKTGLPVYDKVTGERETIHFLQYFRVYNVSQFSGLPEKYVEDGLDVLDGGIIREDAAEQLVESAVSRMGLKVIREGGASAFYSSAFDSIQLPDRRLILVKMNERVKGGMDEAEALSKAISEHYGTAAHELGHATGHSSRLDRKLGNVFGSAEYAFEELVAELCSAFVMSELALPGYCQHVEYLAYWAKKISSDPRVLFTASHAAGKAADMILGRVKARTKKDGGTEEAPAGSEALKSA